MHTKFGDFGGLCLLASFPHSTHKEERQKQRKTEKEGVKRREGDRVDMLQPLHVFAW